jgi:hypothetical protein
MKTTSTFVTATSLAGLLWMVACAGKVAHHRSVGADGGGAGQSTTGGSDDAGSSSTGGAAGTGGRAASSGTGGTTGTGGRTASSGTGGRLPSTGGRGFADAGTTGGGTGGAIAATGGTPSGGVEIGTGGIATGGVEPSTGGVAAGGVEQSTGGNTATAGAAGSAAEPPFRIPNEASACGGFTRTLSGGAHGSPSNGGLPADDYCDASVLRWACNSYATGGLWVQLTRLEFQCCADLHVSLVPEADGYRLSVVDNSAKLCNCICVFDAQAFVERPCEPTTILWDAQSLALSVTDNSSGEEVVSDEPSSSCEPLEAGSSDEVAQALAGTSATLEVTRAWVRTADLSPVDAEYAAVDDAPTWAIVFSEDGSSVTVSETGSEFKHYAGTRLEGDPLGYDLSGGTGGELWIVPHAAGYSAEITLFGSGLPYTQSVVGELTVDAPAPD